MRKLFLLFPPSREVAHQEIWAKHHGGERKLTIFSAPSLLRAHGLSEVEVTTSDWLLHKVFQNKQTKQIFSIGRAMFEKGSKVS